MPSLLDNATRTFVRMSETDDCRLKIANKMIGTGERARRFNDMGMRMGRFLEPMIVEYMAEQGLTMYYVLDEQLEVVSEAPYRIGHNDGLVALTGEPTWWLRQNLPKDALRALMDGELLMCEMKTMNEGAMESFTKGGLAAGAFTKLYLGQINSYLGAWQDPKNDELWVDHDNPDGTHVFGSQSFKELLRANKWARPTKCLVIVYSPAAKQWNFELIDFNPEQFDKRAGELQEMIDGLHEGRLPEPDHDGTAAECYMCPFAYTCPAVTKIIKDRAIDTIPIKATEFGAELDEVAELYVKLREEVNVAEAAMKAARQQIEQIVGKGRQPIVTAGHVIRITEVKGRRTIDADEVKRVLDAIGGAVPYKQGNGYTRLAIDRLYGPEGKDDDNG